MKQLKKSTSSRITCYKIYSVMSSEDDNGNRNWEREINLLAMEELNEPLDPKIRCQFIERIRNWIVTSDKFKGCTDEKFILQFLRVSKYKEEKTKKRIKHYYKFRYNERDWFHRTNETEKMVVELISSGVVYYMNHRGGNSENIFIVKASSIDFKKYTVEQLATCVAHFGESVLEDQRFQVQGCHLIFCLKDIGFDLISQLTPLFLWRLMHCWQNVMPMRLKGIHLINASSIMYDVIRCVKTLLTKKNKDRFFVHKTNGSTLLDVFQPIYLTDELGGTCGPAKPFSDELIQLFEDGKDTYKRNLEFMWLKP